MARVIDGLTIASRQVDYGVEYVDGETRQIPCNGEVDAYVLAQLLNGKVIIRAHFVSDWAVAEGEDSR